MSRDVRCRDLHGGQVLHAEEIRRGVWLFWRAGATGILRAGDQALITAIADLIGEGQVYELRAGRERMWIDRAGNTWLSGRYLAPHQYLPLLLIPGSGAVDDGDAAGDRQAAAGAEGTP